MQVYFSAIQPHLEDHVDIAVTHRTQFSPSSRSILSLGIDNLIYVKDLQSDQQQRIQLPETTTYRTITESTELNSCILGSESGAVEQFNLSTKQTKLIHKCESKINFMQLSPNKRYLALGTEQSKAILINLETGKSSKCRPGHSSEVVSVCFDQKQNYLASIGQDGSLIIYSISNPEQPQEKFQFKILISKSFLDSFNTVNLSGCFNKTLDIYYAPGGRQLQIIQLLNNKWEYRVSKFVKLQEVISLVKMIKVNLMVTSSGNEFVIWNNRTQEKIIEIQNFALNKVIEVGQSFWGTKNDGRIFWFNKKVLTENVSSINPQKKPQNQRMEIQQHNIRTIDEQLNNNDDMLVFGNDNDAFEVQEEHQNQADQQKSQLSYHSLEDKKKKSKADRLITAYPQAAIATSTSIYDSARYLCTSHHGYIIQRIENQYQVRVQYEPENKLITQLLFINKKILFTDFNAMFLTYANETEFGLKFFKTFENRIFDQNDSWEKQWEDIVAISASYNWVAVANDQQIKIFDILGNEMKTLSFDRLIVAMAAYQNLLVVVYHQSIPIDGSQCLAMQLFVVNDQKLEVLGHVSTSHVPLTPKSVLKHFRFSSEGMLYSHDDAGCIRVYSLQHNSWINVFVEKADDTRRIWLLGMKDYNIIFWKTSELNPDPQVSPRLPVKVSRLATTVFLEDPQKLRQYPYLMFQRFALDHEKCRSRLWFNLKFSRKPQKHPSFNENLSSILTLNQINRRHNQLDYKFFDIIKVYIQNQKTHQKALMAAKTLIRTIQAGRKFTDIFDDLNLRTLAVDLEIFFDQKKKQLEFQIIQQNHLKNLKQQAQRNIKPKTQNNPFNRKKNDVSSIPSLNNSQISQFSNFDNLSQKSSYKTPKQNGMMNSNKNPILETPQKEDFTNPFLKKKSTDEQGNYMGRQIDDQIQKYGIKKKADIKRSSKQF